MSETQRCPDCGHENPAGSAHCAACNFPLVSEAAPPRPPAGPASPAPGDADPVVRRMRPVRPRRPQPANSMSVALWLLFGTLCAIAVLIAAVTGFQKNNSAPPVEGTSEDQQKHVEHLREALAKDSTDIEARIEFANILYDTGNWSDAIIQYRSAIGRDSTRVTAIVDLGVCYFNLNDVGHAERLFLLALQREPHQVVALFNLGIVGQMRGDHKAALDYFHRALISGPPEGMKPVLMDAMKRSYEATGAKAAPLPDLK